MEIPEDLRALTEEIFGARLALAHSYVGLLSHQGVEWGLIGPRETERLWDRHILNSVCVEPFLPHGAYLADLGSGAGLPGIPLALARPDLHIDLVEPMERRTTFLHLCISTLGLGESVRVVRKRVQDYDHGAQILTCRALASTHELMEMTRGLVPPAELYAIKGERVQGELAAAEPLKRERELKTEVLRPSLGNAALGTVLRISGKSSGKAPSRASSPISFREHTKEQIG